MSEYLKNKVLEKCNNIISNVDNNATYDTNIILNCNIHGNYIKTVKQILYKNPKCPECVRLIKNKKLSDIGKTKVGELNNFYGRKHSKETKQKLSDAWNGDTSERRKKISNTVKSKEYQEKLKRSKQLTYGDANYVNSKKMRKTKLEDLHTFEIKNNVTKITTIIDLYGYKWQNLKNIEIVKYKGVNFIHNYDIDKIKKYSKDVLIVPKSGMSLIEKDLVIFIKTFYNNEVKENARKPIYPKELDIWLPDLKLAIEYNGNFWHSIENGCPKDFHLMKSLLCREKGIRLIHIYEFEDLDKQKQLLKSLILGIDLYNKNDFNKNNFIEPIPKLYKNITNKGTVYSIGPVSE